MSDIKYAFLMMYNAVVVVTTALSIYYISGWMVFMIIAVMRPESSPPIEDNSKVKFRTVLTTPKTNTEEPN